jgi:class 3 adenylate cyclase
MSQGKKTLAILFADIAKSTQLYELLGNEAAQDLIASCLELLSEVTGRHEGRVIKTIGDEIMCTFPTADDAIRAGIEMHETLEERDFSERPDAPAPNIYVGVQYGAVIREGGDVFGDAVNVAARMVAMAKQRQLITTESTIDRLCEELQDMAQLVDQTNIKGKSGTTCIYEVVWERQDLTVMLDDEIARQTENYVLELQFGQKTLEVNASHPRVTLGRQSHNDMVVRDTRVSRSHSRIEYRHGKFYITDRSTNGTYVTIQGKKDLHLKRDEAQLLGSGLIGLGRQVTVDSPQAIQYTIRSA